MTTGTTDAADVNQVADATTRPRGGSAATDGAALADALLHVARDLRRTLAQACPELPPHQARALRVVVRSDGTRPGALAERMRIAPRTATEVVDALVARGLVERRPDPTDRRAQLVVATDEGLAVHDRVGRARARAADAYFADLPAADATALARALGALDAATHPADAAPDAHA